MGLTGEAICNSAFKYAGIQYFEGNPQNTKNGFDCSGIVQQALSDLGVKIPRTTSEQLALLPPGRNIGTSLSNCQQGDVIHYVGHEEIYLTPTLVFSEATTGTVASVRNRTPWPIVGIVRYADSGPGNPVDIGAADFRNYKGSTTVQQGNDPGRAIPSDPLTAIGSSISSLVGVVTTISKLFAFILDPKNWWRVGLAVFGVALLILALLRLTKTPTTAVLNPATIGKVKDIASSS